MNIFLQRLGHKYGALKRNSVLAVYESLLSERRYDPLRVVEIGIHEGNSLRMFREFLPNAKFYAIDINQHCRDIVAEIEGCEAHIFDQASHSDLHRFVALSGGGFDLVIDDGGHKMHEQLASFTCLFPALAPGGVYAIEDIGTSYFSETGGRPIRSNGTMISFLKSLVDSVNYYDTTQEAAAHLNMTQMVTEEQRSRLRQDVASLHFYPSLTTVERT